MISASHALRAGFAVVSAALMLGCSPSAPPRTTASSARVAPAIAWHPYGKAAFDEARRDGKLVLIDVGIEGCTACRWMYQDTYGDPRVVARMRAGFVAIAVDADVEPDLGARFEAWGWPATIVMTPDGERVLALRGSRPPETFARVLDDVVDKRRTGALRAEAIEAPAAPTSRDDLRAACVGIARRFDADANPAHGGWTDEGPQYIQPEAVELAMRRASVEERPDLRAHALKTLEGWAKMLDPEWGGVYVAAHGVDFGEPIVEKRLVQEAGAVAGFATAYAATRDEAWRRRAAEVDRYVASFLLAPDGTFYSTQQDEPPNLPANMTSADYFRLPDAERRKYGVPPVDHAVYTDQNGQMIAAYASLYEATGDARMLARATRAAEAILATRLDAAAFVHQSAPTAALRGDARKRAFRPRALPYLTAQAHFANGLLALHRVTGEARWLDAASKIVAAARASLEDRDRGGFFSSPDEAAAADKPAYENVVMARALHALAVYAHDASLDGVAERTLRGAAATRGAIVALAVQEIADGPIELTIAGAPGSARAAALYRAALDVYEPRKAVHFDAAHRYPDRGQPALYVCTRTTCSSPIGDPARVAAAVSAARATKKNACD